MLHDIFTVGKVLDHKKQVQRQKLGRDRLLKIREALLGPADCSEKSDFDLLTDIITADPEGLADVLDILGNGGGENEQ